MGIMDEIKRLAHPYEDDDGFPEAEEAPIAEGTPIEHTNAAQRVTPMDVTETPRGNKVVNINTTTQFKVVLVNPEKFEDAAPIADNLRNKRTVVLNLENTEKDISRRLLDFLSGVAYAQEGKIKKVAAATYIITPYNVDIIGDLLDELESTGMYF